MTTDALPEPQRGRGQGGERPGRPEGGAHVNRAAGAGASSTMIPPGHEPVNAARNASGGCAPDSVTLPLMMKNGTPSTRNRRASSSASWIASMPVVAVQHGLGLAPVQTGLGNHVEERLPVADVPALGEVRPEQRLHDRILNAFLVGQPDEPVGVERVRRPLDPVEGEVDAFCLPGRGHLCVEFQRPLPASELLGAIFPAADPFLRHRAG